MTKKIFIIITGFFFLLITASYLHAAGVDLSWDAPEDTGGIEGYIVYWSTTSGSYNDDDSMIVYGESNTNAFISGLDESRQYYFIVRSFRCGGLSGASNEVVIEPYSEYFYDGSQGNPKNEKSGGGCFITSAEYGLLGD